MAVRIFQTVLSNLLISKALSATSTHLRYSASSKPPRLPLNFPRQPRRYCRGPGTPAGLPVRIGNQLTVHDHPNRDP